MKKIDRNLSWLVSGFLITNNSSIVYITSMRVEQIMGRFLMLGKTMPTIYKRKTSGDKMTNPPVSTSETLPRSQTRRDRMQIPSVLTSETTTRFIMNKYIDNNYGSQESGTFSS